MSNKIFGVAFDPPNSIERLNLKLAYVHYMRRSSNLEGRGEGWYGLVHDDFQVEGGLPKDSAWLGETHVDSWLSARPSVNDMERLTPQRFASFFEGNGCWDYALSVAEFIDVEIFPHRPVMIGVDHSLTGGSILALANRYSDLNVVVLDAHFDVFNQDGLQQAFGSTKKENFHPFYHCGNFLSILLEKGIVRPENLWVMGVAEQAVSKTKSMCGAPTNAHTNSPDTEKIKKWIDLGVHIFSKKMPISAFGDLRLSGPTYVSIDMDIGSLASVYSARFMNCYGLERQQFLCLLQLLKRALSQRRVPLVGMDVMEVDIHLLEAAELMPFQDFTKDIAKRALRMMLD